jgi:hypothetical protein
MVEPAVPAVPPTVVAPPDPATPLVPSEHATRATALVNTLPSKTPRTVYFIIKLLLFIDSL